MWEKIKGPQSIGKREEAAGRGPVADRETHRDWEREMARSWFLSSAALRPSLGQSLSQGWL